MGSGMQDMANNVSAFKGGGFDFGGNTGQDISGVAGDTSNPNSSGGSPSWLSQNGTNILKGMGQGAMANMPKQLQGGGGSPMQQVQQPQLQNSFDPNFLLQFMNQGKLPALGNNALYGG